MAANNVNNSNSAEAAYQAYRAWQQRNTPKFNPNQPAAGFNLSQPQGISRLATDVESKTNQVANAVLEQSPNSPESSSSGLISVTGPVAAAHVVAQGPVSDGTSTPDQS